MLEKVKHSEPSFTIAAHPHLSIYITGATKGRLYFWKFEHENDCALDYSAINSAYNIRKLKLNSYGDKIAVNDTEGNLYIFDINSKAPVLNFNKYKILDYAFVNEGSIICATGIEDLVVYDTLMPIRKCEIVKEKVGGQMLLYLHDKNQVLLFNSQEEVKLYDIRMHKFFNQPLFNYSPSSFITSVALSGEENIIITGDNVGAVKIWDIGSTFSLRESLVGFEEEVKQVVVTPNNMLYALGSKGKFIYKS